MIARLLAIMSRPRWLQRRRQAASRTVPAAVTAEKSAAGPAAEPIPGRAVLASVLQLPTGLSLPALLRDPIAAPRPGLHPSLQDAAGYPLRAGWVVDLPSGQRLVADPSLAVGLARSLTLLESMVIGWLPPVLQALPSPPALSGRVVAGWREPAPAAQWPQLDVYCLLDAGLGAAAWASVCEWLSGQLAALGVAPERCRIEPVPLAQAEASWAWLQQWFSCTPAATPGWDLLLSAWSGLDPERLARQQTLAAGAAPAVPGELAAGVLLARAPHDPAAIAHWRALALSAAPCAMPLRQRVQQLAQQVQQGLSQAAVTPEQVDFVCTDADPRAERQAEAAGAAGASCPDLDLAAQYLALPLHTGDVGPAAPLALLAAATAHQQQGGGASLLLGMNAPEQRWFGVLTGVIPPTTVPAPPAAGSH